MASFPGKPYICPPKAEVASSNLAGCAIFFNMLVVHTVLYIWASKRIVSTQRLFRPGRGTSPGEAVRRILGPLSAITRAFWREGVAALSPRAQWQAGAAVQASTKKGQLGGLFVERYADESGAVDANAAIKELAQDTLLPASHPARTANLL